jgi:hypothetical protein
MARARWTGSINMLRIRESVEGASVAEGDAKEGAADDQHLGARGEGGESDSLLSTSSDKPCRFLDTDFGESNFHTLR